MTDYKPQPGERAVFYGSALNIIKVYVAGFGARFERVGIYETQNRGLSWDPWVSRASSEPCLLDPDARAWAWDALVEAKRRHEAGEPLAPMATHELVKNETSYGMHLAPIETKEDR